MDSAVVRDVVDNNARHSNSYSPEECRQRTQGVEFLGTSGGVIIHQTKKETDGGGVQPAFAG